METEQELAKIANAHNIQVKETLVTFQESEVFFRKLGWLELDNVVIMSAEKTEKTFEEADETMLRYFKKRLFYAMDCLRLSFFIHELIHIYEFKLGNPIIEDTLYTENILQNKILLRYLNAHSIHPEDFKLSYF